MSAFADSSTGGVLSPIRAFPAPLAGLALNNFLQGFVVAVTGLDGALVRPRLQAEPPIIPDAATAWASIGIASRRGDAFPYVGHDGDGDGVDQLIRNEELDLLCSFYDLGTNGLADFYAELMRDGACISQNREYLKAQNFDVGFVGDLTAIPSLLKVRWLYRVDLPIQVRRQVVRQYPVLNVASVAGSVTSDPARLPSSWSVGNNMTAPGLAVQDLIAVQIELTPALASAPNLSSMLIIGDSNVIDTRQRYRTYTGLGILTAVGIDFG